MSDLSLNLKKVTPKHVYKSIYNLIHEFYLVSRIQESTVQIVQVLKK